MALNETVLEMHYHRPLLELFRNACGVGPKAFNFYKYSPQRECFIGFDQAYVRTQMSEEEFFELLKDSATTSNYQLNQKFVGYFLQFKVVAEMRKMMKHTPPQITNRPHYRVSLDTKRNINTGLSQHELLYNLNRNSGAMVYYACPMIFDRASLYDIDVDLDTLHLADLNSCPSQYSDNDSHFIYFNDKASQPIWCSDPVKGIGIFPKNLLSAVLAKAAHMDSAQSAKELRSLLMDLKGIGIESSSGFYQQAKPRNILSLIGDALTVVQYSDKA